MKFPYRTIGVVPKIGRHGVAELLVRASQWLSERQSELICFECNVPGVNQVSRQEFAEKADLIMALGGDGTFLTAGRLALARNVPILGVNMGRLGFLTEITVDELFPTLERIQQGEQKLEIRHLLHAEVKKEGKILFQGDVINDAVVTKTAARLVEIETRVDDTFLALFKADGLIIATPTGSTAYSLAAGGPIVFPTMEAIIMTPICPHSLNQRPLVIPDHFVITVHIPSKGENVTVTLDGQTVHHIAEGEYLKVRKSPCHLKILKSPFKSYFEILKSKLRWAEG